ncbi:MAG: phosphatase PAP2 family protein [Candidatus Rokuibacteriota bacterium]
MLLLSLLVFVLLATTALLVPTHAFELTLRGALVSLDDDGPLGTFWRIVDHAGTWRVILPGTLIVFAVFPHARAHWWIWTVAWLAAPAAETFFKVVIGRPRPEDLSMGFPSGHATAAAAFFGAVIYLAAFLSPRSRCAVRMLAVACIVLVAIARVALRAHWPSDAVAGIALGLALASIAQLITGPRWGATSDPHFPTRADPEPTRPPS